MSALGGTCTCEDPKPGATPCQPIATELPFPVVSEFFEYAGRDYYWGYAKRATLTTTEIQQIAIKNLPPFGSTYAFRDTGTFCDGADAGNNEEAKMLGGSYTYYTTSPP
jgi:hypothetical protein